MAVSIARKLFSIDEYERMIEAGIFDPEARVELIDGEIVEMTPINLPHAVCVTRLELVFHEMLGRSALVWAQNPVRIPDKSRPQPEVTLLKWRDDLYAGKHPEPNDVILFIEVSDSTLREDRKVKVPLYARGGIPQVWIVNLNDEVVEVYSDPGEGKYKTINRLERGESLTLPGELGSTISVDTILG
jgi:Uma2 family endonuclease